MEPGTYVLHKTIPYMSQAVKKVGMIPEFVSISPPSLSEPMGGSCLSDGPGVTKPTMALGLAWLLAAATGEGVLPHPSSLRDSRSGHIILFAVVKKIDKMLRLQAKLNNPSFEEDTLLVWSLERTFVPAALLIQRRSEL